MQAGKNQMAGFRGSHGRGDGFAVAHFTDHDNIRILAKKGQGEMEIRVSADFALGNDAAVLHEKIFDRVFDRDDVICALMIYFVRTAASVVDFP